MTNQNPTTPDLGPDAPVIDSDRIEGFYDSLSKMHVELDGDPLEFGPKRLNSKTAECRTMLSRCEKIFLEISQDLHWYKRRHRMETAIHELKIMELRTNDPDVRSQHHVADREAVANTKLRSSKELINKLHSCMEDLEAVLVVVRTKRADLKDIQGRLKDQLKICQEEISLGGRWGSKSKAFVARDNPPPQTASDEVDEMMDSVIASQTKSDSMLISKMNTSVLAIESEISPVVVPAPESFEAFNRVSVAPREVVEIKGESSDSDADDMLSEIPTAPPKVSGASSRKSFSDDDLEDFLGSIS